MGDGIEIILENTAVGINDHGDALVAQYALDGLDVLYRIDEDLFESL